MQHANIVAAARRRGEPSRAPDWARPRVQATIGPVATDERLRRLTRETSGLGTDADRARLLVERVRAGALTPERLQLAAALGHRLACMALGREPARANDPGALLAPFEALGPEARARLALAAARLALSRPAPSAGEDDLPRVHAALTAWVRSGRRTPGPVEPRRLLVSVKFSRAVPPGYRTCYLDGENLSRHLARVVRDGPGGHEDLLRVVSGARRWATRDVAALARERGDWVEWWAEAGPVAGKAVVDALRGEVAPWAVGDADPLVPT